MSDMQHYIIRIKERNNSHIVETEAIGSWTKRQIIAAYGLEEPDVESYTIQIAGTQAIYGHRKGIQG